MEFISKIQKLRRIAIPKNVFDLMKLNEDDLIQVSIKKIDKNVSK